MVPHIRPDLHFVVARRPVSIVITPGKRAVDVGEHRSWDLAFVSDIV